MGAWLSTLGRLVKRSALSAGESETLVSAEMADIDRWQSRMLAILVTIVPCGFAFIILLVRKVQAAEAALEEREAALEEEVKDLKSKDATKAAEQAAEKAAEKAATSAMSQWMKVMRASGAKSGGEVVEAKTPAQRQWEPREMTLDSFRSFETIIFDCDGVIWGIHKEESRRSVKMVNFLLSDGKRVMFVTNNSNKTRHAFLAELQRKGVDFGSRTEEQQLAMIISAAFTTAKYLKAHKFKHPFVLTSDSGLLDEMEAAGVKGYYATIGGDGLVPTEFESGRQDASMGDECVSKAIDKDIDCIVVGWDSSINARKVGVAVNIIAWHEQMYPGKPRLQIIACSVDASGVLGTTFYGVPKTEYKVKAVGNGAMASFIAHCFDPPLSWVDLGKPSDALIEMLSSPAYKIDLKKSLMVGDTLQTDIVFGTRGVMSTLLVLTGVAYRKAADAAVGDEVPVFISERLGNYEDTQPLLEFDACKKIGKLMRRELVTREQLNQNHTSAEYNSFACTVGRVAESRGLDQVSTDYEPPPPVLRSSTSPSVVETVSPLHHPLTRNDSLGPGRSKRATIALPDEVLPVRSSTSVPSAEGSPKRQLHRWNTSSRRMSMGLAELRPDAPKQYIKLAAGLTSKMAQHVQKTAAVIRPLSRATSAPAGVCVFDTETRSKLRRKRAELLRLRQALTGIKNEVAEAQNQSHTSTRTGFLEPLVKKIGNPPARPWENEWKALNVEFFRLNGELSKANEDYVHSNLKLQDWRNTRRERIKDMVDRGWTEEHSDAYMCLSGRGNAMSAAMNEKSGRYAASTFALSRAIYETAVSVDRKRKEAERKLSRLTDRALVRERERRASMSGTLDEAEESSEDESPLSPLRTQSEHIQPAAAPRPSAPQDLAISTLDMQLGAVDDDAIVPVARPTPRLPRQSLSFSVRDKEATKLLRASFSKKLMEDNEQLRKDSQLPNLMYWHRSGKFGLEVLDPNWRGIEESDENGFRGLTCCAIVKGTCEAANFPDDRGYAMRVQYTKQEEYVSHECDVIAFESLPSDDTGMHSAVLCENDERGAFPPNTLFRLKKIHAPGTWAAPGGHYPQQRLLIMTATYRAPSAGIEQGEQGKFTKLFGSTRTLEYGNRDMYVHGLGPEFSKPVLSMEDRTCHGLPSPSTAFHWPSTVFHRRCSRWRTSSTGHPSRGSTGRASSTTCSAAGNTWAARPRRRRDARRAHATRATTPSPLGILSRR